MMFYPWTCGYRRGAVAVAVALKDDPRLHKEHNWLLVETIGIEDVRRSTMTISSTRSLLDQAAPTLLPLHYASSGNDL